MRLFAAGILLAMTQMASAVPVVLDAGGRVFTLGGNDGWDRGRGIVFQASQSMDIDSVGAYLDLTGAPVTFNFYQTLTGAGSGNVLSGATLLATQAATVTTSGLEFVDFNLGTTTLTAGNFYAFQVIYNVNANQNYYYDDVNGFTVGDFANIDGFDSGGTSNTVAPAFRVNLIQAPEIDPARATLPATFAFMALALVAGQRRRRLNSV